MYVCACHLKSFAAFEGISLPWLCTPTSACWCSQLHCFPASGSTRLFPWWQKATLKHVHKRVFMMRKSGHLEAGAGW